MINSNETEKFRSVSDSRNKKDINTGGVPEDVENQRICEGREPSAGV